MGAAPGGTRRQTGNEHRPSPLPAGADGSPWLRGKSRAGEGTGVTGAGARGDRDGHWPHKQPHIHAWGLATTRERLWQRWGAAPWLAGVLLAWLSSWDRHLSGTGFPPGWASLWNGHPSGMGILLGQSSHWSGHPTGMGIQHTGHALTWAFPWDKHPKGVGISPEWASLGRASFWDRYPTGMGFPPRWAPPCDRHPWGGHRVHTSTPAPWLHTWGHQNLHLCVWGTPSPVPTCHRGPHSLGSPPRAGNPSGPLRLCRIKGCGMTLPPPEISRGADSGKVDV